MKIICQPRGSVLRADQLSSRATASQRAAEIVLRREYRQATPSRWSVSPHSARMSADWFVNMPLTI